MSDTTLKRASVIIKYTASDSYRVEFIAKGGTGSKHRVTGEEVPSENALLAAIEELARVTALFGFEAQALERFTAAQKRVADWKARRKVVDL